MTKIAQHPIPGKRHDPVGKHRFRVIIAGFEHMGFSKVSGLNSETMTTEYREGDDPPTPRKYIGRTTYEDVTLERGAGPDSDFMNWRKDVFNVETGTGLEQADVQRQVVIQLLNNKKNVVREWQIPEAWAKRDEHDDLDAASDDLELERLVLAHNGCHQTI